METPIGLESSYRKFDFFFKDGKKMHVDPQDGLEKEWETFGGFEEVKIETGKNQT